VGNEKAVATSCNTGKCPVGICTQDPRLVARLDVDAVAQNIVDYFLAMDVELKKLMAPIGNSSLPIGRSDALVSMTIHRRTIANRLRLLTLTGFNCDLRTCDETANDYSNNQRTSTQELLQQIYAAMDEGETEFALTLPVSTTSADRYGPNRAAAQVHRQQPRAARRINGMPGTEIIVEGPAPADVGWLNAGATIVVKGDGGDTTGHCAADGLIYIGGRAGTRTGSLMKHDPAYAAPQLWILKNTGSFLF